MGKVYRAVQAPLGRVCALKVLSPRYDGEDDPEFRRRFFLEASTAAKLTHANTVTIFDYGKADNDEIYYIAMEYIEGRTLSGVLQEAGPLPEERVRHIAAQICRSLREAHGFGVVHRDLKPGNIMLSDKGDERDSVKVLDFGLVKDVTNDAENHTQEGVFMGSPKYMAPEQILGVNLTPRADIYSLGIMLYEMLTGKVPYDRGGANIATLMAHVNEPLPNMRVTYPDLVISQQMEGIVYRCLEKDPARRYASMSALLLAVKGLGEDGAIDTSGPYPAPRAPELRPVGVPFTSSAAAANASPMQVAPQMMEATVVVRRPPGTSKKVVVFAIIASLVFAGTLATGATFAVRHFTSSPSPSPSGGGLGWGGAKSSPEPPKSTEPPKPTAAPSTQRVVHVESDPPGALVTEGTEELCASTPCDVVLTGARATKEHRFTLVKNGFRPSKPLLVDAQTGNIGATLVPVEAAPTAQPSRKKPSEQPKKGDPSSASSSKPDPYKPDPYQ